MQDSSFNSKVHSDAQLALARLRAHALRSDAVVAAEREGLERRERLMLAHRRRLSWWINGVFAAIAAAMVAANPLLTKPDDAARWLLLFLLGAIVYGFVASTFLPDVATIKAPLSRFNWLAELPYPAHVERLHEAVRDAPALKEILNAWLQSGRSLRCGDCELLLEALPVLRESAQLAQLEAAVRSPAQA